MAKILEKLLRGSDVDALQAYQIAFDIQETENQGFVLQVVDAFPSLKVASRDAALATAIGGGAAAGGGNGEEMKATIPADTDAMETNEGEQKVMFVSRLPLILSS